MTLRGEGRFYVPHSALESLKNAYRDLAEHTSNFGALESQE